MAAALDIVLARGVAEGVITDDQAQRLRVLAVGTDMEAPGRVGPPPTQHAERPSLVTEALGYLGGIIVLVGAILVASQFWPSLGEAGQLAIVIVASAALLVAGVLLPVGLGQIGTRLRAVLWVLSVAAFGGALGLLFYQIVDTDSRYVPLLMFALTTAYACLLWAWRPTVLQLAVAAAGTALTAGSWIGVLDISFSAIAAAVLAVGAVWIGLGLAGVVRPVRATIVIGSLIALISAQLFVIDAEAPVLGLLTAAGLVGLALHRRDLLVLGIGSIGILLTLPIVIYEWFPSVAAAAISLLVVGGFLVGAAVYTARRKTVGSTPR